ncbi:hypothetical protein COMA1_11586 [Candidatus Nitrospira nitrosa]|uniref:Uncharacterized protein n=1 Tax=Candidatus Nitrospira nitrosa TaxID=1742972 RepID=A0A0S4LGG0_9BACT|nr:hypothetical protein COMA1_11586 [Candidatus Nitrospira nitrosa]
MPSKSAKRKSSAVVPTAGTREPMAQTRLVQVRSVKLSASAAMFVELYVLIVISPFGMLLAFLGASLR